MNVPPKLLNRRYVYEILLFLVVFTFSTMKSFALSLDMPPEYLTQKADLIILGRVSSTIVKRITYISATSSPGKDINNSVVESIFTKFEVDLLKSFKRELTESNITILTRGGVLPNGDFVRTSATVKLAEGDCILAFLAYDELNEKWGFYGGSRGVFRVDNCAEGSSASLVSRVYEGHFVPRDDLPYPYRKSDEGLTLQELLDIIMKESK